MNFFDFHSLQNLSLSSSEYNVLIITIIITTFTMIMIKSYISLNSKCSGFLSPSMIYIHTNQPQPTQTNYRSFISSAQSSKPINQKLQPTQTKINDSNNTTTIKFNLTNIETQDKINQLLKLFPPIKYGFAYGSGVISQKGYNTNNKDNNSTTTKESPMIDLVFAVENSTKWHSLNLVNNSSHYSFLGYLGAHIIAKVQAMSAKIYFNTLLEHNGIKFKYGIIEYKDLIDDLKNWRTLYLSGRMQKPIYHLPQSSAEGLKEITTINQEYNLRNAVITALLMLPEQFDEYQLFHTICKLSYSGDIRMKGAENPMKTHNIVVDNIVGFRVLYFPVIEQLLSEYLSIKATTPTDQNNNNNNNGEFQSCVNLNKFIQLENTTVQFKSKQDSMHYINLIMMLPDSVKSPLLREVRTNMKLNKKEMTNDENKVDQTTLFNTIFMIVSNGSLSQTFKGILTAGVSKSLNYMKLKLISSKKK